MEQAVDLDDVTDIHEQFLITMINAGFVKHPRLTSALALCLDHTLDYSNFYVFFLLLMKKNH